MLRATHGTARRGDDAAAAHAPGRGHHGHCGGRAGAGHDRRAGAPRPTLQGVPEPAEEDQYESILAVPILARENGSTARSTCARSEPREFTPEEIELLLAIAGQVAQSIEHAKLYAQAQRRVGELEALARISEAVSESLYLEESLEAIVKTTMDAVDATGAALVLEDGQIAWPEGRAGAHAVRLPLRWKGRQIGELVADRDTPFTDEERAAARVDRAPGGGRARARAGGDARRARPGDPPPRQEQPPDGRLAAAPPGAVERRASTRARRSTTRSNRILAIAAVHEVLTEQRDDDVDLAELLDRLRAMLVQGLGARKTVEADARAGLAGRAPGDGARARLQRAAPERARARRRRRSRSSSQRRNGEVAARDRRRRRAGSAAAPHGNRALDRARARPRRARRHARRSRGDAAASRAEVASSACA